MGKIYNNPGLLASAWEILVQRPLDDRAVVEKVADLTDASTWKSADNNYYHYKGMLVTVSATGDVYVYIGANGEIESNSDNTGYATSVVNPDNWKKINSDSELTWNE